MSDEEKSPKAAKEPKRRGLSRPFPRVVLEQALRVPMGLKEKNAGNPWPPQDVAKALGVGPKGGQFFYLSASSRDYGLTTGTRDTARIELTPLGRRAVFPANAEERAEALQQAFFQVDTFKRVFDYYRGSKLPEAEYLSNTLQKEFGLEPDVHEEFVDVFQKNCKFLGLATQDDVKTASPISSPERDDEGASIVTLAKPKKGKGLLCFVIMPFTERSEDHDTGFFGEVIESLIAPAGKQAGFTVRSAQRQGSDVIQKTIVNDLLSADLVIADLTEHNPNVMFELGMRMAHDLPIALIRARGTGSIFDVDNMLRVYDYDPRLWPSTIKVDLPRIQSHIEATWDNRGSDHTYMKLLGRLPVKSGR